MPDYESLLRQGVTILGGGQRPAELVGRGTWRPRNYFEYEKSAMVGTW